ncbi:CLUMA_CG016798, isoform A [Clunio marinus]|uniref:CLUMA_CG016798, isoform A n=1 Tax=Clunio marinus TaxID=568069 RepID=A0A1J1IVL6_9DIPT|nr:CLUMA_CG016798, isoform A [Clunio marinus]
MPPMSPTLIKKIFCLIQNAVPLLAKLNFPCGRNFSSLLLANFQAKKIIIVPVVQFSFFVAFVVRPCNAKKLHEGKVIFLGSHPCFHVPCFGS